MSKSLDSLTRYHAYRCTQRHSLNEPSQVVIHILTGCQRAQDAAHDSCESHGRSAQHLRAITSAIDWGEQRSMWCEFIAIAT